MARIKLETTADVRGAQRLNKELEKSEKQLEEITKTARGTARQAQKIAEQADPTKRLNREYANLAKHVKAGRVSLQDAEVVAGKLQRRMDRLNTSSVAAVGPKMLGKVTSLIAGYVSLNSAIQLTVGLMREQAQLVSQAAERSQQTRGGVAPLAQLAATQGKTQAEREQILLDLEAEAKSFAASGAAPDVGAAGRDVFGLVSAGLNRSDRDFARDVQASGALQNVADAGRAFASLQATLGAAAPKTFEDFLDQAIQASAIAPAQAPEIPLAASRAAGSAAAIGIGPEFLNAATAYLAKATGDATQGGTQLAQFLKGIESEGLAADPSLRGLSGVELVRELASRNLDRAGLEGLLGGRQEAISGARTLINVLPQLEQSVAAIRRADAEDLARQTIDLPDASPGLRIARGRTRAETEANIAEQNRSADLENLFRTGLAERRRNRANGTETQFGDFFEDYLDSWVVQTDFQRRTRLRNFLSASESGANPLSAQTEADISAALAGQLYVLRRIESNTAGSARQE